MKAIVYTSNTGNTERYARLLGSELKLPVYDLSTAVHSLEKDAKIIYLGWIMADEIKGYKQAVRKFRIPMVCAVGMSENGTRIKGVRQRNAIPEETALFVLQGGLYLEKLKGIQKLIMKMMARSTGKKLSEKKELTENERVTLELFRNGGNCVRIENLREPIEWYERLSKEA